MGKSVQRLAAWLIATSALVVCGSALAQTPDYTLFGPKQYLRTDGSPNQFNDSFSVPPSVGEPFLLRVVNGAANGQDRVNAGSISINGVQVVGPADFAQSPALIERSVSLTPSNVIEVNLPSKPGSYITLSVLGTRILPVPSTLAPNPLSVSAGATATLTATLTPTPTTAGSLNVSSADPSVASVPSTVSFAVGQATVLIPVMGVTEGTTSVTASANGGASSATINVTPAPPTVTQLAPANLTLTQGAAGTLTITISAAQATPTLVAVASSSSAIASVPSSVTVPAGQVSAPLLVSAISPGDAQISVSLNGSVASSHITVVAAPPTPVSLLPALSTVTLGAGTALTLTISSAQPTDTVVPLSVTPAGIVTAPAEVTVPAGQPTAPVPVATLAYGQAGITASLNGASASAAVNVIPPPVVITALEPAMFTMTVGATSTFTVRINAAQIINTEITLEASNPAVLQVPGSVIVAQGATSATFTATGLSVGDAVITASANGTSKAASVHVSPQPAAIVSLLPSPLPLQEGATGSLTVTINVAQEVPTTVDVANTAPAVATTPSSIVIAGGAISAHIPVTAVAAGTTQISASVNGTSANATVEVTPPPPVVSALTPAALTLPKGTPGLLRVHVSRAPNVATAVGLVSSDVAVASVPPQVHIPAGALFADFPVTTNSVGQATITASLNGGSASSAVTVAAAELAALTLSPQLPTNYVGEAVPFSALGTMSDGSSEDFTSRVTWSSANTDIASIAATGVATPLAAGQTVIKATYTFTAAQTGQPVTVSQETTLTVKIPTALVLSTTNTAPVIGQTITMTITTSDPPPFGGLPVNLTGAGSGAGTFPPTVTIPQYQASVSFEFTATAAGSYSLTASAQNRLPATLALTILPQFLISSFTPGEGPVGTAVAIHGSGFDPNLSGNTVRFNGELAVIASGSPILLNVIVPPRATTGPITVTNSRGTVASATPFTVQDREAFDVAFAPALVQLPTGGMGSLRLRLSSIGLNPYPYAATLAVSGLPNGVTATLDRATIALNQDAIVTLNASGAATAGSVNITVTATGASGVSTQIRIKTVPVQVLAAGSTTVTGRVFHADDGAPFVGARIRLAGAHVFTDETGTYRFVNAPVLGDQVLLIDGNTNNTAQFEYPSGIAMPAMIVAGQDNKVLTSYIQKVDATKFTTIVPGAAASVTSADIPNFSLNIPQGATLFGWDNQPITKINVRTVAVDRLPIRPIPDGVETRNVYLYYFFREGGADPTQRIPVTMPNDLDALPGETVTMWYYDESATPDPNSNQWRVMGTGTVTQDGKSVASDPGFGIPKFCCGASFFQRIVTAVTGPLGGNGTTPPSNPPQPTTCNPVDLATGNALAFNARPFGISKFMTVNPNCQYRSTDPRIGLFGRGMTFNYDWFAQPAGDTVRVTNPDGVPFTLSREPDGAYRARSGRSGGFEMEVFSTFAGRRLRFADGTEMEFDGPGRLLSIKDLSGNTTSFHLNPQGVPFAMTDAAGKIYQFELIGTNPILITKITDPAGRFIRFEYDANRLVRYHDQAGNVTHFAYDAANRVRQVTDPRTAVKQIEYDAAGRATRELLPENAEERYAYSATGATVSEARHTDANGNVTTFRFNGLGFETSMTDALGRVSRTARDPVTNLMTSRTDPAGRVTQYFYNPRGELIRIIDADNKETKIEYDPRFRKPTRIENALGHVTLMVYNAEGKMTSITNAENETTILTYTPRGQLESITDALNRVASFEYDASGNAVSSSNTANETVTGVYDDANRLIELTDNLNRTTRFSYDNLDRVTEVRDALQGLTKLTFDANDNLVSAIDPNNNPVERNAYDLRNRLKERTDAKNRNTLYDYDGNGNLVRMVDRKGQTTEYRYDELNRLTRLQDHAGRTTIYTYDLAGNLTRMVDTESGDILMRYDSLDRLTEVVTSQGTVTYAYDAIGRRTSRTLSGSDITNYTYDKANRIKTVTSRGQTASYAYDLVGRLSERVLPNGIKTIYQYDNADRILAIEYRNTNEALIEAITYTYDLTGQRISRGNGSGSLQDTPINATYDEANRLTSVLLNGQTFVLAYDENGNLASKTGPISGTTTYTWTARNQLAAISSPDGNASFRYDALGRRVERTVNGHSTGFIYDADQAIAELAGNAVSTAYHTGIAIDEVLARYSDEGSRILLTDGLNSVLAQTSDDQTASNFYAYSPYGEVAVLGSEDGNSLRYSGREDDGTGLYYYRARYYDPHLKRFISVDPIGLMGGPNAYAYVGGDPIGLIDPDGLLGNSPGKGTYLPGQGPVSFYQATGLGGPNFNKRQCVQKYLNQYYGSFVANTLVPTSSLLSYVPGSGTAGAAWTSAVASVGSKAVLVGGTYFVGQMAGVISAAGAGIGVGGPAGLAVTASALVTISTVAAAGFAVAGAAIVPFATAANVMALNNCSCTR